MAEPSKVIHVRNVGHEISEVLPWFSLSFSIVECSYLFVLITWCFYDYATAQLLCFFLGELDIDQEGEWKV